MSDWNANIIEEFRNNEGRVGGMFEGRPMLLLHHTGARTGTARVNPLTYRAVGDGYAVFASKAGAPTHPDWFHNLLANPETAIEVGTEIVDVTAWRAEGEERADIWREQMSDFPVFAEYEASAGDREIPVIILEPR